MSGGGLVGWWRGEGNANDAAGANHGTLQNGATFAAGTVGQAFSLDGTDDYVGNIGTPASYSFIQNTGVFTIDAWIRLDDPNVMRAKAITANTPTTADRGYFFLYENSTGRRQLRMALLKAVPGVPVIDAVSADHVITNTAWHHVAVVGNGTGITFYVDGTARQEAVPPTMGSKSSGNATRATDIGRCGNLQCPFDGGIDDLAIYDRALSAAEIQSIYSAGAAGRCAVSIDDVTVTEGNSGTVNATFTVSLSAPNASAVNVNYATANGTATTANSDYAAASGTLTIPAKALSTTVTVAVNGDLTDESNETFFVNLSSPVNATLADGQGQATITDDDGVPSLSIADLSVAEGNAGTTSATFTVSLSHPSAQTVTVSFATADGTATTGDNDYVDTQGTATILPKTLSTTVTVPVRSDFVNEADQTFFVNLSSPVNATIADGQAQATITNDDPVPALSIGDQTVGEGIINFPSPVPIFVHLSNPSDQAVTVSYATSDGTATAGADYGAASGILTIPARALTTPILVQMYGDFAIEPHETFLVDLSDPANATIADDQARVTIIDGGSLPQNVPLNDPAGEPADGTQADPVLGVLGDKVVALWMDAQPPITHPAQLFQYAVSTDSGATFTDLGAPPAPTTGGTWRWRNDPHLQVDPGTGEVWIAGQVTMPSPPSLGVAVVRGTFAGSTLVWDTPILVRSQGGSVLFLAGLSLALDPISHDLFLLWANIATGRIELQRSQDHGATWSAPAALSNPIDAPSVSPFLIVGPNSVMHAAWVGERTGHGVPIRYRSSIDAGTSWSPEQTVVIRKFNPMWPMLAVTVDYFTMAVQRATGVSDPGRVAIAWSETWDFDDEPFSSMTSTPRLSEIESNDDPVTANAFAIGQAVTGGWKSTSDVDHWNVMLNAGDQILVHPDSTAMTQCWVSILRAGFSSRFENGYSSSFDTPATPQSFSFRAPVAGIYTLRIAPISTSFTLAGSYYRVRTRYSTSLPNEARDQRDLVVARGSVSGVTTTWSAPTRYAFTPPGYDDFIPSIGWGADGLDYVTWHEFSQGVPPATSRFVVARNLAGSDPVPSPPEVLSSSTTDWSALQFVNSPIMGRRNAIVPDLGRTYFAWGDGRSGNPNVLAASMLTSVLGGTCPPDTTVPQGGTLNFRVPLTNANPLFEEKVLLSVSGTREWLGFSARDSIPAKGSGFVVLSIAVPGNTPPGNESLCVLGKRQSGIQLFDCCMDFTITGQADVGEPTPQAFGIDRIAPNPATGPLSIRFGLPAAGPVALEVFDVQGARVATLVHAVKPAGTFTETWSGRDDRGRSLPPGVYVVRLSGAGRSLTRRIVLMK